MPSVLSGQSQRTLLSLAVVCLLLIAGCSSGLYAPGAEQDTAPTLVLNNTANTTHTFTVWVVDGGAGEDWVTVYSTNKGTYTLSPRGGVYHRHFPEENVYVTEIEPRADRSRLVTRVSVQPGETHQQNITNFSIGDSLMVTAAEDDRVFELVVSNCDEQSLVGLEVMSRPEPSTANSFRCR